MTANDVDLTPPLSVLLRRLPDPTATDQVTYLEAELAGRFEAANAVAVSSGTAALHTALVAAGIRPGDEVLVPALSVPMSVAPIVHAGATPVFVDSAPGSYDVDHEDLAAKITPRTRGVEAVHLWGRAGDPDRLARFAADHDLALIEDACQAHGSRHDGQLLGTFGDAGCFSLRDGKILWSGEGGFILTHDETTAAISRGLRTHWQSPITPPPHLVGYNYRLAEPLAAIARANLARFDDLLAQRRHQTQRLHHQLAGVTRLHVAEQHEGWNGHAPILRLDVPRPRELNQRLAARGVPNSVGTYGLIACDQRPVFGPPVGPPCRNAAAMIDHTLAVVLTEHNTDHDIDRYAQIITEEIRSWPNT
jgi:perosamine synthetase